MKILIPTYYREEKQKCWKSLPEEIKKITFLCTRYDRVDYLKFCNPKANIIDLGITDGIADTRQKLINIANNKKILIVDDNTTFLYRDTNYKLHPMKNTAKFIEMLNLIEQELDNYAWVGISDRAGNNRVKEDKKEIIRSYSCYGINTKKFNDNNITFDGMYQKDKEIKLFEDFYALMKMLSKSMKNLVIYKYAFNHPHGKEGGNSMMRTSELHEKCLRKLADEFPGYIKFVIKKKPSWTASKSDNHRFESVIQWKKLYESSL